MKIVLKKRLEGVLSTDVWVGKAKINGVQLHIEWHFLSELWRRPESRNFRTPVQLKVFFPTEKVYKIVLKIDFN